MERKSLRRELVRKLLDEFILPEQVRKKFNEQRIRELGESMLLHGQLQPVGARTDGTLRWGFRRWHAAKLVGLDSLDALITDEELSESEIIVLQLTENLHRQSLTAWEMYEACDMLLQLRPDWKITDLANQLNRDPSSLTRTLSPSRTIPAVREALKAGKIGVSDCYAMSKESEDRQAELLEMKLNGASRDEIERARRQPKPKPKLKRKTPRPRLSEMRCPLPGGGKLSLCAETLTMDAVLEMLMEMVEAVKNSIQENHDISQFASTTCGNFKAGG